MLKPDTIIDQSITANGVKIITAGNRASWLVRRLSSDLLRQLCPEEHRAYRAIRDSGPGGKATFATRKAALRFLLDRISAHAISWAAFDD